MTDYNDRKRTHIRVNQYLQIDFKNSLQQWNQTKLLEITHLISSEGEKLEIAKPIRVRGATEQWLGALVNV